MTHATSVMPKRRSGRSEPERDERATLLLPSERRVPFMRLGYRTVNVLTLLLLVIISAGPLTWLFKAATSTSQDSLTAPFALWPSGIQWNNLADAWNRVGIAQYLLNTAGIAAGAWFFGLLVATTGAYVIAILRPRYARVLEMAVLGTLFVPAVVSLVSLYLTVVSVPVLDVSLINTFWAVWLPAATSAFNVLVMTRFFAAIPRELFEAARVDGASNWTIFARIVLPMSRPALGVVSLLIIIDAWKDFLWPMLVLPDRAVQPLSVALPRLAETSEFSLLMAGMFISVLVPVTLFLVFQRQFLSGAGQAGALKG